MHEAPDQYPILHKSGMVAHAYNPSIREEKQKDQIVNVISSCSELCASLGSVDPVPKKKEK